jgi:hypothetical protein
MPEATTPVSSTDTPAAGAANGEALLMQVVLTGVFQEILKKKVDDDDGDSASLASGELNKAMASTMAQTISGVVGQ